MGKTKQLLQQMNEANQMIDDSYQYQEWLESDEFVEYVNRELDTTKLQYSESDIMGATRYASKSIILDPSEVGKEVYDMLFSEKIEEYLSLYTQR
jgi:hypothetical protein